MTAATSNETPVLVDELLSGEPPVRGCAHARVQIRERVAASGGVVLVLHADPTGSQAVHDVPLLTAWDEQSLDWAFGLGTPMVFDLTNMEPGSADVDTLLRGTSRRLSAAERAKRLSLGPRLLIVRTRSSSPRRR